MEYSIPLGYKMICSQQTFTGRQLTPLLPSSGWILQRSSSVSILFFLFLIIWNTDHDL